MRSARRAAPRFTAPIRARFTASIRACFTAAIQHSPLVSVTAATATDRDSATAKPQLQVGGMHVASVRLRTRDKRRCLMS